MDWPIHAIARMSGITSRTLRHYHRIGLLEPSRIGDNGYRHYDEAALVRLQRILLLRDLGLPLATIGDVLAREIAASDALRGHLQWLRTERARLGEQIVTLESTIASLERKEPLMAETMFQGFDHTHYRDEVTERWGADTWRRSNDWWSDLSDDQKAGFQREQTEIATDFAKAHRAGADPASAAVQAITARHYRWICVTWTPNREAFTNLGQMYVDDPRFTAAYDDPHGAGTAQFIATAMRVYAEQNLA